MALFKRKITDPSFFLLHSYGVTEHNRLDKRTKRVLKKGVNLMERFPAARCLIFETNFQDKPDAFEGTPDAWERTLKKHYLRSLDANFKRIDFGGGVLFATDEVDRANDLYDLKNLEVVSVCDSLHTVWVYNLWEKITNDFQPKVKFKILGVSGFIKSLIWGIINYVSLKTQEIKQVESIAMM